MCCDHTLRGGARACTAKAGLCRPRSWWHPSATACPRVAPCGCLRNQTWNHSTRYSMHAKILCKQTQWHPDMHRVKMELRLWRERRDGPPKPGALHAVILSTPRILQPAQPPRLSRCITSNSRNCPAPTAGPGAPWQWQRDTSARKRVPRAVSSSQSNYDEIEHHDLYGFIHGRQNA